MRLTSLLLLVGCTWLWTAPVAAQRRRPAKPDPQAQLLQYYRQYPDRYIKISESKWEHEAASRAASHSLTLLNTATVSYCNVEIRITYETESGAPLFSRSLKLPGPLTPFKKTRLKHLKVVNVQGSPESAVVRIASAAMCP